MEAKKYGRGMGGGKSCGQKAENLLNITGYENEFPSENHSTSPWRLTSEYTIALIIVKHCFPYTVCPGSS